MLNQFTATGRIINETKVLTSSAGKTYCPFRIAINRDYKGEDGKYPADFVNCAIWGTGAKSLASHFSKGDLITISGRLQTRNYTKDNVKREVTEIIVNNFYFVGSKPKTESAANMNPEPRLEPDAGDSETEFLIDELEQDPFEVHGN